MWWAKQAPARGLVASQCHKWTYLVAENCLPRAIATTAVEICRQGFGERTKGGTPAASPSTSEGRLLFTLGSQTTDPALCWSVGPHTERWVRRFGALRSVCQWPCPQVTTENSSMGAWRGPLPTTRAR